MKARNRTTCEIVDIIAFSHYTNRSEVDYVSYIDSKGIEHDTEHGLNFYWDFELIKDNVKNTIDWEQRRFELGKAALQGILSNEEQAKFACSEANYGDGKHTCPIAFAQYAIACANALIEELKKNK